LCATGQWYCQQGKYDRKKELEKEVIGEFPIGSKS